MDCASKPHSTTLHFSFLSHDYTEGYLKSKNLCFPCKFCGFSDEVSYSTLTKSKKNPVSEHSWSLCNMLVSKGRAKINMSTSMSQRLRKRKKKKKKLDTDGTLM